MAKRLVRVIAKTPIPAAANPKNNRLATVNLSLNFIGQYTFSELKKTISLNYITARMLKTLVGKMKKTKSIGVFINNEG
jgi:hypothetical protein